MRVMISQPMKGLSAGQIREKRAAVVAALEAEGHEVVDTVFTETPPENGNQALWCLGKALQAMSTVDAVYFMDGYENARGCMIEYVACRYYGIKIANMKQLSTVGKIHALIGCIYSYFPDDLDALCQNTLKEKLMWVIRVKEFQGVCDFMQSIIENQKRELIFFKTSTFLLFICLLFFGFIR